MSKEKQNTKQCKHCKSDIPYGSKVCPNCRKKQGGALKWAIIAFVAICIIGAASSDSDKDEETATDAANDTNVQQTASRDIPDQKEDSDADNESYNKEKANENESYFSKELKKYKNGNYPYIKKKDLAKYHANMGGVKFCTIIKVDDIKDGVIQSTINDGFMMSNFNSKNDYRNSVKEGDTVAIIGKVKSSKSYGFLGKSLEFSNCMVIAKGKNVNKYKQDSSDESLSQYFVITKEVANSRVKLTEDEYKSICETLNYTEIMRNPDSFEGTRCKVSGSVSQIVEGFLGGYTIYVEDSSGNKWGCTYSYKDGESHLLDGDSVTIYGECKGTDTTTTVLGKQVTMPRIDAEYIN